MLLQFNLMPWVTSQGLFEVFSYIICKHYPLHVFKTFVFHYKSNAEEIENTVYLVVHVFDDQQHRTVHVHQHPVQGLEAGPMLHGAVDESPRVTLNTGW